MNVDGFLEAFNPLPQRKTGLDEYQTKVVTHATGPLWVIAGPGSGKTDSIVLRCLKLIVVDGVTPRSIIVTTFTEKAARNIEDRVASYMRHLIKIDPSLQQVDYTRLRVGTLHGLCNDIMQEFRYVGYQNFRLLSDMEQRLFITEHSSLASIEPPKEQLELWTKLPYLASGFDPVTGGQWRPQHGRFPNRWVRARGAQMLFNRIVEERVAVKKMRRKGGFWSIVSDAYEEYRDKLFSRYRCDFAHLQAKFLDFLTTPQGKLFLQGDGTDLYPGVSHVLVDEYQDTNPMQEEIYLRLASPSPHNLCVVGDDDQALYRFRGGTVECMVNFAAACKRGWGTELPDRARQPLPVNYRSHEKVVSFCDSYIRSFGFMSKVGARAPGKQPLEARSGIRGTYPAVAIMTRKDRDDLAGAFADTVAELRQQGTVQDYGQCALLLRSTRATPTLAEPFMVALSRKGIPVYNPRSRSLLEEEEVQTALGAFLAVVDPDETAQRSVFGQGIHALANSWREAYGRVANGSRGLADYVNNSAATIKLMAPQASVKANIAEILYHIMSYKPFTDWMEDRERTVRLGVVTQVFEAFSNVPPANREALLGDLFTSSVPGAGVSFTWRKNFYYSLLGILASEGLNEPEDSDEHIPPDRVPIMTVHQAKGLQFPFVSVYGLSPHANLLNPNSSVLLETDLASFREFRYEGAKRFTPEDKVRQDLVRFFYVAYSRAQYALILLATQNDVKKQGIGFGGNGATWLVGHVDPI